jgi:transposase-like protein
VINALNAPVEAAWRELGEADKAAAAVPARIPLGTLSPDMVRLDTETKQITHAIRMAAYNAETTLARALDGRYARVGDEVYALIREALTTSGDICPGPGQLLIRLDPLTAPRRTRALAALCDQLTTAGARYPGTDLVLRYEVKSRPILHKRSPYVRSPGVPVARHLRGRYSVSASSARIASSASHFSASSYDQPFSSCMADRPEKPK